MRTHTRRCYQVAQALLIAGIDYLSGTAVTVAMAYSLPTFVSSPLGSLVKSGLTLNTRKPFHSERRHLWSQMPSEFKFAVDSQVRSCLLQPRLGRERLEAGLCPAHSRPRISS